MVEGGMSCVKYILFVFNFIFVIFGGLLIYFGFMVIQEGQDFKALVETPDTMAIGVIVVGFFIFLIAFLGCCGALMESYCILLSFGIIVTIILAVELGLAGLAFAFKTDLRQVAEHGLTEGLSKYNWTDSDAKYTRLIDDLQWNVKCCGANNASDWLNKPAGRLPNSCCPRGENVTCVLPQDQLTTTVGYPPASFSNTPWNSPSNIVSANNLNQPILDNRLSAEEPGKTAEVFDRGCVDAVVDAFGNSLGPVGGVCLAVALFQLLGILFAFCLGRAVKQEYQVV